MTGFAKATKQSTGGSGVKMEAPLLGEGGYPARLLRITDLGEQAGSDQYPDPSYKMSFTFECLDEFMVDAEGKELPTEPRTFDYDVSYNLDGFMGDRSNIYKIMTALDGFDVDYEELLGRPLTISLVVQGTRKDPEKKYNKLVGVSAMRTKDAEKASPLVGTPSIIHMSMLTKDIYENQVSKRGGEWSHQGKIKNALNLWTEYEEFALSMDWVKPAVIEQAPEESFEQSDADLDVATGGTVPAATAEVDPFA